MGAALDSKKTWTLVLILHKHVLYQKCCFIFLSLHFPICKTGNKSFDFSQLSGLVRIKNNNGCVKWGNIHKPELAWSLMYFIYCNNLSQHLQKKLSCFSVSDISCFTKARYVINRNAFAYSEAGGEPSGLYFHWTLFYWVNFDLRMVDAFLLLMKSCCYWVCEVEDSNIFLLLIWVKTSQGLKTKSWLVISWKISSKFIRPIYQKISLGSKKNLRHHSEMIEQCTPVA